MVVYMILCVCNFSSAEKQRELKEIADVYGANNFEEFMEDPKCSRCGKPAEKR